MKYFRVTLALIIALILAGLVGCNKSQITSEGTTSVTEQLPISLPEVSVTDYRNKIINFKPDKIVVFSSALVSILDYLEVNISGTSNISKTSEVALVYNQIIPEVGSAVEPDFDKVASIEPDIVISGSMFAKHEKKLTEMNLPMWMIQTQSYNDVLNYTKEFGRVFDREERAEEFIKSSEEKLKQIKDQITGKESPTVLILMALDDGIVLAGDTTFVGSTCNLLGCRNLLNDIAANYEIPAMAAFYEEELVKGLNPDVILEIHDGSTLDATKKVYADLDMKNNPVWKDMNAVKNDRVYELGKRSYAANPGANMMDSIERLVKKLFEFN